MRDASCEIRDKSYLASRITSMNEIVGIDLGTTNSLIGVMDAGFPILLADKNGERLVPSVVHFPKHGEPIAGREATRMGALDPGRTIYPVKRLMGLRRAHLQPAVAQADYSLGERT